MNKRFNIHIVSSRTRKIEVTEVVCIEIPHPIVGPWREDVVALKPLIKIFLLNFVSKIC
jgi:hypothetical protein